MLDVPFAFDAFGPESNAQRMRTTNRREHERDRRGGGEARSSIYAEVMRTSESQARGQIDPFRIESIAQHCRSTAAFRTYRTNRTHRRAEHSIRRRAAEKKTQQMCSDRVRIDQSDQYVYFPCAEGIERLEIVHAQPR